MNIQNEFKTENFKQEIKKTRTFTVFIDGSIKYPDEDKTMDSLTMLRQIANQATKEDIINLVINSYGGSADTMLEFIKHIKETPASLHLTVTGAAMSAGALIFTYGLDKAKEITIMEASTFMYHSTTAGFIGKPEEAKDYNESLRKNNKNYLKPVKKLLKKKQWKKVIEQEKELWLTGEEMMKLLNRYFKDKENKPKITLI